MSIFRQITSGPSALLMAKTNNQIHSKAQQKGSNTNNAIYISITYFTARIQQALQFTTCVWKNKSVLHAHSGRSILQSHAHSTGNGDGTSFFGSYILVNHGCLSAAAAVSRLSGLHVSSPLSTWNPSSDSFVLGNTSRSRLRCFTHVTTWTWVANGVDENHGHVVSSGTPRTSKMAASWPAALLCTNRGDPLMSSAITQPSDQVSTRAS